MCGRCYLERVPYQRGSDKAFGVTFSMVLEIQQMRWLWLRGVRMCEMVESDGEAEKYGVEWPSGLGVVVVRPTVLIAKPPPSRRFLPRASCSPANDCTTAPGLGLPRRFCVHESSDKWHRPSLLLVRALVAST